MSDAQTWFALISGAIVALTAVGNIARCGHKCQLEGRCRK